MNGLGKPKLTNSGKGTQFFILPTREPLVADIEGDRNGDDRSIRRVHWSRLGEGSPKRKGYRNAHYTRNLVTSTGRIEDLKVPRDREGQFHTQTFERYSRYEPHIAEGLTQMFVAGTSTQKVGEVAQTLMGVAGSRQYDQSAQPNAHSTI